MAQSILLKRSSVAGNVPDSSDLSLGEIAINTADGAVYIKKGNNDIVAVHDNDILHIDTSNSRVGIGTTSPNNSLHVVGSVKSTGDFIADTHFTSSDSNATLSSSGSGGNVYLRPNGKSTSTGQTYINTSGVMVVNTTSTSHGLEVAQSTNTGYAPASILLKATQQNNRGGGIYSYNTESDNGWYSGSLYNNTNLWAVTFLNGTNFNSAIAQTNYAVLTVDGPNSRVGIGTTSPAFKLSVDSGTTDWPAHFKSTDNKAGIIIADDDTTAYFGAENSRAFMGLQAGIHANNLNIDASGNVGIGTTSPDNALHVKHASTNVVAKFESGDNQVWINLNDDGGGTYGALLGHDSDAGHIFAIADNSVSKKFVIDNNSNVGIGVTDPATRLEVKHDSNASTGITVENTNTGTGARAMVELKSDAAQLNIYTASAAYNGVSSWADAGVLSTASTASGGLILNSQSGGITLQTSTTERLKVNSAGSIRFNNAYTFPTSDGSANQVLQTDGSGNLSFATVTGSGGSTDSITDADGDTKIQVEESSDEDKIRFDAAGTERFRIGSDIEVIAATDFNITGTSRRLNFTAGSGTVRTTTANSLILATNNTTALTINSSQNATFAGNITLTSNGNHVATRNILARDTNGLTLATTNATAAINIDNSANVTMPQNLTVTGNLTASTIDVGGDLTLDADGGDVILKDGGTEFGRLSNVLGGLTLRSGSSSANGIIFDTSGNIILGGNITGGTGISTGGRIQTTNGLFQANEGNQKFRQYEIGSSQGTETFLLGKIENGGNADGGVSGVVRAAYDYGETVNNCNIHFAFAQRSGAARGHWWYENTDDDASTDVVSVRLVDDGSGGMFVWLYVGDYVHCFVEAVWRQCSSVTDSGTLSAGTITTGTTLFDTANDPTSEHHIGKLYAHSDIHLLDNKIAYIGTGDDLQLQHNGSHSYIRNYTGDLFIRNNTNDGDIHFQSDDGSGGTTTYFSLDGGNTYTSVSKNFLFQDNVRVDIGNDSDLRIVHNATNSFIENRTGDFKLVQYADDKDIAFLCDDGSGGITEYFSLDGSNARNRFHRNVLYGDGIRADFGDSSDLKIYHNGTHSHITNTQGSLYIRSSNTVQIENSSGNDMITAQSGGAVTLFHNAFSKLATKSDGVDITGELQSDSLDVDGNADISGNLVLGGNLTVNGTTTTLNTATLDVEDNNITLNKGSGDTSGSANGAGITIQDAVDASTDATILWDASNDEFDFSHAINTAGAITAQRIIGTQTNGSSLYALELTRSGTGTTAPDLYGTNGTLVLGSSASDEAIAMSGANTLLHGNLEVEGADVTVTANIIHKGDTDTYYGFHGNDLWRVVTGGLERFEVSNSGIIVNDGGANFDFRVESDNDANNLFSDGGNDRIGIGTSNPLAKLAVHGPGATLAKFVANSSSDDALVRIIGGNYNTEKDARLFLGEGDAYGMTVEYDGVSNIGYIGMNDNVDPTGAYSKRIGMSRGGTEVFFTAGNVGIGTTTPSEKLEVSGKIKTGGQIRSGSYLESFPSFSFANDTDTGMFSDTANQLEFATGGTSRLIINSSGDAYFAAKVFDADVQVPNQNLLDIGSIQISNRNDITGNSTKTIIDKFKATYANDNTGGSTIRLYVDDGILVDGDTYTVSVYYEGLVGTLSMDWCDVALTGSHKIATGTTSSPGSGRIYGYASRSDYNSTYRFLDINLSQGANDTVTLFHPKVEEGTQVTDFVGIERTNQEANSKDLNNLNVTGKVGIGTTSPSYALDINPEASTSTAARVKGNGHASLILDRASTSYDSNLTFSTGGTIKWRLWNDGSDDNLQIRDEAQSGAIHTTFKTGGNLGIGETNPVHRVEAQGTDAALIAHYSGASRGGVAALSGQRVAFLSTSTNDDLVFGKASNPVASSGFTEYMRIDNGTGRVGIGTSSPTDLLTITGDGKYIASHDGTNYAFMLGADSSGDGNFVLHDSSGNVKVKLYAEANAANYINNGGSFGIGTSSPSFASGSGLEIERAGTATIRLQNTSGKSVEIKQQSDFVIEAMNSNQDIILMPTANVGIGTASPGVKLTVNNSSFPQLRLEDADDLMDVGFSGNSFYLKRGDNDGHIIFRRADNADVLVADMSNKRVAIGTSNAPKATLQVEEYGIDTTETSSTATTQIAIHTFAATDFRSARFTVQVTNSTDSTYHTTELLLVHDGTTANITEFGEIHTGSAVEATFDCDVNSGNVRLLATPASTDTMAFKVVCHSITT